jgi:tetratricopeptide (TPR) repeat protein
MMMSWMIAAALSALQGAEDGARTQELADKAYAKLEAGDLDGAAALFDEIVRLAPKSPASHLMRAEFRLFRRRQPAESLQDLDHAVASGASGTAASRAFQMRSEANMQLMKFGPAMEDAQKALAAEPKDVFARLNLCMVALRMGADEEAVKAAGRVLDVDPLNGWAHSLRAQANLRKGRLEEAWAGYQEALRLEPRNPMAWVCSALVRVAQGKPDEAIAQFEKGLAQTSVQYCGLWLWKLRLEKGDRDGARRALDEVLKSVHPDPSNAWYRAVAAHLAGTLSEDDLLKTAARGLPIEAAEWKTEALFFAGARRLADGDRAGAAERFGKAKAGAVFALETVMADLEIKRMQK